jgi:hypothetical protein
MANGSQLFKETEPIRHNPIRVDRQEKGGNCRRLRGQERQKKMPSSARRDGIRSRSGYSFRNGSGAALERRNGHDGAASNECIPAKSPFPGHLGLASLRFNQQRFHPAASSFHEPSP